MSRTNVLLSAAMILFVAALANAQEARKTEVIQIYNAYAPDLAEALAKTHTNAHFVSDSHTNKIMVTASAEQFKRIKVSITELDVRTPQVRLEFAIFSIQKGEELCLSSPSIATGDGQTARILVGQSMPIRQDDGSTVYEDIGIQVYVLAKKQADGRWQVNVTTEHSEIGSTTKDGVANLKVIRNTIRSSNTLQSGDTGHVEASIDGVGQERLKVLFKMVEEKF